MTELFGRAIELPLERRDAFLAEACAGDRSLLDELRELLRAHEEPGALDALPEQLAADVEAALPPGPAPRRVSREVGSAIGNYHVVGGLGSGGMGDVYLAERDGEGFNQRVAIKVLRREMQTDATGLVTRFHAERGILARLEHPNIPRFLDGGITTDGAPYIAMEYVDGTPIDRYCDEHGLSTRQRLALFVSVCDAMQYAHQHLVVHRDLKPANILVTGAGAVKVLDFGIAKILDTTALRATSPVTGAGQRWMTPDYASPEQVRGEVVSTASDVFALGIVLYELLACRRPHLGRTRHEVERAILEVEPTRPSDSLPAALCVARGEDPKRLRRELTGDLDTITMKALSKAPERRYGTAGELADDIRRYLAGLPVRARPDTFAYRARKYFARHRLFVAAALLALVSLIGGIVGMLALMTRASAHAARAEQERERAEEVSRFAVGLFSAADPRASGIPDVTARELLDSASARLGRELSGQPGRRAALLLVLSRSYAGLGRYEEAQAAAASAVELRRAESPVQPAALADALEQQARNFATRMIPDSVAAPAREALALRRASPAGDDARAALARSYALMGSYHHMNRAADSAGHYFRAALAATRPDPDDEVRAEARVGLANALVAAGKLAAAESLYVSVVKDMSAAHPSGNTSVDYAYAGLIMARVRLRDMAGARAAMREVIALRTRLLGPRHPEVVHNIHNMGYLFATAGQPDSAAAWYTRAAELKREVLGADHASYATTLSRLGFARRDMGDVAAAESLLAQASVIYRTGRGGTSVDRASARITDSVLALLRTRRE